MGKLLLVMWAETLRVDHHHSYIHYQQTIPMGEIEISMSFVPPAVKTLFAEETTVAVPVAVVAADIELH